MFYKKLILFLSFLVLTSTTDILCFPYKKEDTIQCAKFLIKNMPKNVHSNAGEEINVPRDPETGIPDDFLYRLRKNYWQLPWTCFISSVLSQIGRCAINDELTIEDKTTIKPFLEACYETEENTIRWCMVEPIGYLVEAGILTKQERTEIMHSSKSTGELWKEYGQKEDQKRGLK